MRLSTPTSPSALRFALIAIALLLGLIAQGLVAQGSFKWAITPFVIALGSIGLATFRQLLSPSQASSRQRASSETHPSAVPSLRVWWRARDRERLSSVAALGASALFLIFSLLLFPSGPPYTAAWWLYGLSMILLLVSLPALDGRWTALARRVRERPHVSLDVRSMAIWAALAGILLFALIVRVHDLSELPVGFWHDEAADLLNAARIQQDPGATPVFMRVAPVLYLLPAAALIGVIGLEPEAIRLASVGFSVAGVFAVFLLVRLMLGSGAALIAAFILAAMRWDINFARIGMVPSTLPLFTALAAYLTLRALRTGRISDFGFAGFALGLGFWFYASFQIFPLVVGAILLHHVIFQRPEMRRFGGRLALMALVALAVAAPVAQFAVTDSDEYLSRLGETSVFRNRPLDDALRDAGSSFARHALMFNVSGDANARHNLPEAPMLDFLSGALLVLGVGIALARWRSVSMAMLPVWLVVMALPGVMTLPHEAPQALRAIGVIPAVAALVALPLAALWSAGRAAPHPLARRGALVALVLLLGVIALLNVNTYFGKQASDPRVFAAFSTDGTLIGRHMREQQARGYTLLSSRQFKFSLQIDLEGNRPAYDAIFVPQDVPIDAARVASGAAIYLEPREAGVFRLLRAYYPDAHFEEVRPPGGGEVMFYIALISREQLEQQQGLVARYILPSGEVRETVLAETEAVWFSEFAPDEIPAEIEWTGALHIREAGEYLFALEVDLAGPSQGETDVEVFLDGRRILRLGSGQALGRETMSLRIEPAVGLHTLEVRGRVAERASALRLLWQPPDGELSPIPLGNLFNGSARPLGLAGQFHKGENQDLVDAAQVTPFLDTFWYEPPMPEPYLAVWEGTLNVPLTGSFEFEASGFGQVRVFIDGTLAARHPGGLNMSLDLNAGEHAIRVEYAPQSPPSQFEVLWTPAGAPKQQIPIELLTPDPERMFRALPGR